jgi:hypothetical protein
MRWTWMMVCAALLGPASTAHAESEETPTCADRLDAGGMVGTLIGEESETGIMPVLLAPDSGPDVLLLEETVLYGYYRIDGKIYLIPCGFGVSPAN